LVISEEDITSEDPHSVEQNRNRKQQTTDHGRGLARSAGVSRFRGVYPCRLGWHKGYPLICINLKYAYPKA
jgi:hypothetical protein